ncbi:prepilin-type N-terminal cleavage/methylation domain-containing protein [Patescibacteria group bacterium]|nr:prepilin-type N-terminal cleavage/methylation domain-containing protein [Patescibacteria group bacterium]
MIIKNQKGISIIETIIYLAIVGILLTAVVNFYLTLANTSSKLAANVDVSRNRRVALSAVDYLMANSDGLLKDTDGYCSDFGASPPSLALYFNNDNYLPGNCVETGGGVRITVDDRRLAMTCYPNMNGNGHHKNCDTTVYPAVNTYYLTSMDVDILNGSLVFSSSTATSTSNPYTSVTTLLSVGTLSGGQINKRATSTASSTVVMYSEPPSGLVSFWSFEEGSGTTPTDYQDSNDLTCAPGGSEAAYITGIVDGSSYGLDFEATNSNLCTPTSPTNPNNLNFSDQFTISSWMKPESLPTEGDIVAKETGASNLGYKLWINSSGDVYCRVYDSTASQDTNTSATVAADGSIYLVTCVYDYPNNRFQVYVYKKANSGVATSTSPGTVLNLVNDSGDFNVSLGSAAFDGIIDDLRIYNRALSEAEIWALQSQGDY